MSDQRERLLAQLAQVRDEWADKYGDLDMAGVTDADADTEFHRKAKPILDKLAALSAVKPTPRGRPRP